MSTQSTQLENLGLSHLPEKEAFRVDLSEDEFRTITLDLLDQIARGQREEAPSALLPVPVLKSVVSAGIALSAASDTPRIVAITNNSAVEVMILEGGTPDFSTGLGTILNPGDYFESPRPHTGVVNAKTRPTESGNVSVVVY